MKYISYFRVSKELSGFMSSSMISPGRMPGKVSTDILLWRLSNTVIGSEIMRNYYRALSDATQWREAAAVMLQSLSVLFETVELCADKQHDKVNGERRRGPRRRLQEIVSGAIDKCRANGCSASALFDYIMECRNVYVHSGIMPYVIDSEGRSLGLNDFLRHKFRDNRSSADSLSFGRSAFNSSEDSKKFRALCNLILSALCLYFDSLKPSLTKYAPLRYIGLYFNITVQSFKDLGSAIIFSAGFLLGGSRFILKLLIGSAVVSVIVAVLLLAVNRLLGFAGSKSTCEFTDVEPRELVRMVEEMSGYEQMVFLKDRRSALRACGIRHRVGDSVLSPADIRTEMLYTTFKNYPDPTAHPFRFLPGAEHLARKPFWGAVYSQQWGGEKLFTSGTPSEESVLINYMPVYSGDCYPLMRIDRRQSVGSDELLTTARRLASYPRLDVYILYGTNSESILWANEVKRVLTRAGVRSSRIKMAKDFTNYSGLILGVGGVSNYSRRI